MDLNGRNLIWKQFWDVIQFLLHLQLTGQVALFLGYLWFHSVDLLAVDDFAVSVKFFTGITQAGDVQWSEAHHSYDDPAQKRQ